MAKIICVSLLVLLALQAISATPHGNHQSRIFGGNDVSPGQFSFVVGIKGKLLEYVCGGAVVSQTWILTSAGCLNKYHSVDSEVIVGTVDISPGGGGRVVEIAQTIPYPDYDAGSKFNDLALLQTTQPMKFNRSFQPAKLALSSSLNPLVDYGTVTQIGWGASANFYIGMHLQYRETQDMPVPDCQTQYTNEAPIGDSQICTRNDVGQGACYGDEGGPLITPDGVLVGVNSFSVPCASGYPDVYTRVETYADWINQYINQ